MHGPQRCLAFAISLALTGCGTFGGARFEKAADSGVSGDKIALLRYSRTTTAPSNALDVLVASDPGLATALKNECGVDTGVHPAWLGPGLVPIIAAVAQLGVNLYFDAQKRRIEDIVEGAQASYSATMPIDPAELSDTKCLLLLRYAEPTTQTPSTASRQLGLSALVQVDWAAPAARTGTQVVVLKPVYLRAATAAAQTRKTNKPTIGVAIALSLKALGRQQSEIVRLLPSGEGTMAIANLGIGALAAAACTDKQCKPTDLIPFPTDKGPISLTLSVAEQGITGFNDKVALAEIAALKEALGPAVAAAVKARFED